MPNGQALDDGVNPTVTYYNGSPCSGGFRNVTFTFKCDPYHLKPVGAVTFQISGSCMHHAEIYTCIPGMLKIYIQLGMNKIEIHKILYTW